MDSTGFQNPINMMMNNMTGASNVNNFQNNPQMNQQSDDPNQFVIIQ